MDKLPFGTIVLLKFPFTDGKTFKKRPALLIQDSSDGDIIVCRITSQIYDTENDVFVTNWKQSGLKLPSVIRVHKIATLDKTMIEVIMGKIDIDMQSRVKDLFLTLPQ